MTFTHYSTQGLNSQLPRNQICFNQHFMCMLVIYSSMGRGGTSNTKVRESYLPFTRKAKWECSIPVDWRKGSIGNSQKLPSTTVKEGWRAQWPKCCEYSNQDENASMNGKAHNDNSSSKKFQYKTFFRYKKIIVYSFIEDILK